MVLHFVVFWLVARQLLGCCLVIATVAMQLLVCFIMLLACSLDQVLEGFN